MDHVECPYVDCNSSDAFSYDENKQVGYCHSCHKGYPSSHATHKWAKEKYPAKPNVPFMDVEVAKVTYEGIRGLDPTVAKLYGIQLHLDANGHPIKYAFKHPDGVKYRGYHTKDFKATGPLHRLFGPPINAGTSKKLYITEGEFDAASLYQAMGQTYPVMSLPTSGIGDKFFKNEFDFLSTFEQIIYAGELDKAGKEAADKFYAAFPAKMFYVPMSKHKDANEFLMSGSESDLKWAALKPQRYSPENFYISDEALEKAITEENPYQSFDCGHDGIKKMTRGIVKGGVTFIKAPRGTGKTEVFRYLQYGLLKNNPTLKIALIHMEEPKSMTYRGIATYELGVNVRTREDTEANGITEAEVIAAAKKVKSTDRIVIFELLPTDEPIKIVEYCRICAAVYGADFIFIDHIQRLIYRSGAENATGQLTQVGTQLAELCKELNIGVIAISHVNDQGSTQYAKALENEAIICVNLERDIESEDEVERNTTEFIVDKNRPFSKLGSAGKIYYDPSTTILAEV